MSVRDSLLALKGRMAESIIGQEKMKQNLGGN